MQMHKILTVWTSTGNLKYTCHDTFLWTEDTYHSHENRVFILYFGFIHNEHKVNTRSTNHTSLKEQKHGTLTCLNSKYTIQILHIYCWVLSPEQNTKSESENVNTNVMGVSMSKPIDMFAWNLWLLRWLLESIVLEPSFNY